MNVGSLFGSGGGWRTGRRFRRTARHHRGFGGILGMRFGVDLFDRPNHVKRTFGVVLKFILQNAVTPVERVRQAHVFAFDAAELFGREKGLGQKSLEPAGATDDVSVIPDSCSIPSMAMMSLSSSY